MGTVIVACIILHNMIIEDEYTDPKLDNEYLFEENDNFKVDKVNHDNCDTWFNSLADMCRQYMSEVDHHCLKWDLIEHLWAWHGGGVDDNETM